MLEVLQKHPLQETTTNQKRSFKSGSKSQAVFPSNTPID